MMRMILALLAILAVHLQVANGSICTLEVSAAKSIANCAGCSLHAVPELPFYITHLHITQNYIKEVNKTSFSGLRWLQELDLGWQLSKGLRIRNNTFVQLTFLRILYLGNSIGLSLEPDAFVGLSNLRLLSMYTCTQNESILEAGYLQPLVSLEILDLSGNNVRRIQPAPFFASMLELKELKLTLNQIDSICEADLVPFQGKHFRLLKLDSVYLRDMVQESFDWERCGNPFRNMSLDTLDLSLNGFREKTTESFFNAIEGSKIQHLVLRHSGGKGYSYNFFSDPDKLTYKGLSSSDIKTLDLSKSYIFSLKEEVFRPFGEAEEITLAYNNINQINAGAFLGLENLKTLNLSHNLLGEVHKFSFENLRSLLVLDLSYNHIGVFENNAFKGLSRLEGLDLRGNSIRKISTLSPLPNLLILRLDDNKMTSGSISNLRFASNIRLLYVQNNRLTNLEDVYTLLANFPNLEYLQYGDNFIMWCTLNNNISIPLSNHLKVLDLEKISLQTIWAQGKCLNLFDNLSQLNILTLNHNSLQSLPQGIFKGLNSVKYIDLSFNLLTYLQPNIFPERLQRVDLSYNLLAYPDPLALHSLSFINLTGNMFYCDCHLMNFLTWLNTTSVQFQSPVEELKCEFPSHLHGISLLDLNTEGCEDTEERFVQDLRLTLFICCSALLILITTGAIAFARLRGYFFIVYKRLTDRIMKGPNKPPDGNAQYDAFLCFSNNDFKWVEKTFLNRLDSQFAEGNVFRCCFEARDFLPGEDHMTNIRDAVWGSRKTVCVVSQEFLKDGWCLEAFVLAQGRMLEELRDLLIVVMVGKIPHYKLMKHDVIRSFIQKKEYLHWPEDDQDIEWFYDRLTSKILKDIKMTKKKNGDDINIDIPLENIQAVET